MSTVVAMSVLRSATVPARSAASRLTVRVKPRAVPSSLRISSQKPLSARIFRSPVEMSSVRVSQLPYHSATASAVLTSMLSVAPRCHGWNIDGL